MSATRLVGVWLEPWSESDLSLLEKLLGDPEMMEHLGGPETLEQIAKRHQRYLHLPETDHMYSIHLEGELEPVGSIGFWEKHWRDQLVYETGWHILPSHQGRGIAPRAGEPLIQRAREEHRHRYLHAFPSVDNPARTQFVESLASRSLRHVISNIRPAIRCAVMIGDWIFLHKGTRARFDLLV